VSVKFGHRHWRERPIIAIRIAAVIDRRVPCERASPYIGSSAAIKWFHQEASSWRTYNSGSSSAYSTEADIDLCPLLSASTCPVFFISMQDNSRFLLRRRPSHPLAAVCPIKYRGHTNPMRMTVFCGIFGIFGLKCRSPRCIFLIQNCVSKAPASQKRMNSPPC